MTPSYSPASTEIPDAYREAVRKFAANIGQDPQPLLEGLPFDCKGVRFRLEHYGPLDPYGMVVMAEVGTFAAESEPVALRQFLEHNAMTPAALSGYYSLMPGSNLVLYCMRLDLQALPSGEDAIAVLIGGITEGLTQMLAQMRLEIEDANLPQQSKASSFA